MDERKNMINDTIGIYARVDSGKTSLTEALLYTYGNIKELGKVDSRSTLLDTDELEKKRGITIFSKSAILRDGKFSHSLIDTPGHGDFSSQLLYTLWVIDMAILIVDATYGVDYYTKILWTRLRERKIPIVIFVNKMDALKGEKEKIEKAILHLTSKRAVPWQSPRYLEDAAIFSEDLTEVLLQESPNLQMARDVALDLACKGEIVPVIYGSATKLWDIEELITLINSISERRTFQNVRSHGIAVKSPDEKAFEGLVYKISYDKNNQRIAHIKIERGKLFPRDEVFALKNGEVISNKVNQIRIINGSSFTLEQRAEAGQICGILSKDLITGMVIKKSKEALVPMYQPKEIVRANAYQVICSDREEFIRKRNFLRRQMEIEPALSLSEDGEGLSLTFFSGGSLYIQILNSLYEEEAGDELGAVRLRAGARECVAQKTKGFAFVDLSKSLVAMEVSIQRSEHGGSLTFSPMVSFDSEGAICLEEFVRGFHGKGIFGKELLRLDVRIESCQVKGKDVGRDLLENVLNRAIYQGILKSYSKGQYSRYMPTTDFEITCEEGNFTRVLSILSRTSAKHIEQEVDGIDSSNITIKGNMSTDDYCEFEDKISSLGIDVILRQVGTSYEKVWEAENHEDGKRGKKPLEGQEVQTSDVTFDATLGSSIIIKSGADEVISWQDAEHYKKVYLGSTVASQEGPVINREYTEADLVKIFNMTYGAKSQSKRHKYGVEKKRLEADFSYKAGRKERFREPFIIVDGYNLLHQVEEFSGLLKDDYNAARDSLIERLVNYAGYRDVKMQLVFDAYKKKDGVGSQTDYKGIEIVYTKEGETADAYIERFTHDLAKKYQITVITSDNLERQVVSGHGASSLSARLFWNELLDIEGEIREKIGKGGV